MKRTKGTETSAFGTKGRINHDSSKFYNSKLYTELGDKKEIDKNENDFPDDLENTVKMCINNEETKLRLTKQ